MTAKASERFTSVADTPSAMRASAVVCFSYPVLWMLGLGGLFWPLLTVVSVGVLVRRKIPFQSVPVLGVAACLVFSLPIGLIVFGVEFGRILGLLANVTVWVGIASITTLVLTDEHLAKLVIRAVAVISAVQGALILIASVIYPASIGLPLLRGWGAALPSGLRPFAAERLYYYDWLGEQAFRSAGIMANPTWAGAFGALAIFALIWNWHDTARWRWIGIAGAVGGVVAINFSLSRSVWGSLALAAMIYVAEWVRSRDRVWGLYVWTAYLVSAITAAVVFRDEILGWFNGINSAREGSGQSRGAIYSTTIEYIQQLTVPILGYGIKPQDENLVASVASHSTYLGIIFRGGILALVLLLVALSLYARTAWRSGNFLGVSVIVFVFSWLILEDFDPGHLVPLGIVMALVTPPMPQAIKVA